MLGLVSEDSKNTKYICSTSKLKLNKEQIMSESQAVDQYISDNFADPDYRDFMAKVIDTSLTGYDLSDPTEPACMPMDEFIAYMLAYPY